MRNKFSRNKELPAVKTYAAWCVLVVVHVSISNSNPFTGYTGKPCALNSKPSCTYLNYYDIKNKPTKKCAFICRLYYDVSYMQNLHTDGQILPCLKQQTIT
jgi:hypothetical protein